MNKVLALRDVANREEPDQDVIALLEGLLERAKAGNIRAMAYAVVSRPESLGTGWDGAGWTRDKLSLAISVLQHRYVVAVVGENEE